MRYLGVQPRVKFLDVSTLDSLGYNVYTRRHEQEQYGNQTKRGTVRVRVFSKGVEKNAGNLVPTFTKTACVSQSNSTNGADVNCREHVLVLGCYLRYVG